MLRVDAADIVAAILMIAAENDRAAMPAIVHDHPPDRVVVAERAIALDAQIGCSIGIGAPAIIEQYLPFYWYLAIGRN
jgi:hypothetical protein